MNADGTGHTHLTDNPANVQAGLACRKERARAYHRRTEMPEKEPTPGGLVRFHTACKLTRKVGTRVPASRHGSQPI